MRNFAVTLIAFVTKIIRMRRILFSFMMSIVVITAWAQDRTFESCPLEVIAENWKSKPIERVVNGSLGIMLEAFDKTWPTYVVAEARDVMEKGLEKYVDPNDETERTVVNDAANGYVEVSDAGTDSEYMSACVWNRSNGHRLFAVEIGKPTDPDINFVCFYDYDEYTWMLRPEPNILVGVPPLMREWQRSYKLPRKGKDMVIVDYGPGIKRTHYLKWNGMKPVYRSTEESKFE